MHGLICHTASPLTVEVIRAVDDPRRVRAVGIRAREECEDGVDLFTAVAHQEDRVPGGGEVVDRGAGGRRGGDRVPGGGEVVRVPGGGEVVRVPGVGGGEGPQGKGKKENALDRERQLISFRSLRMRQA
jgi:hypothetical protein